MGEGTLYLLTSFWSVAWPCSTHRGIQWEGRAFAALSSRFADGCGLSLRRFDGGEGPY
jgi:hypothetical protein